jgi:immunity protein 5 of polymorphic toxin system
MTDSEKMLVSIAIDAARNCLHVFEREYPTDDRSRKALAAAEKWFHKPTIENLQLLEKLETQLWRSEDWPRCRSASAAQACGCAARAIP